MHVCKKIEGVYYLLEDFNIKCYDQRWFNYLPFNIASIVVYPIGIPLMFFYVLWKHRLNFRRPDIRAQLGFLYDGSKFLYLIIMRLI